MVCLRDLFILSALLTVSGASLSNDSSVCDVNQLYQSEAELNFGLILNECLETSPKGWTYINSAIWTIDRLADLNLTNFLSLGLSVFQTCAEDDYYNPIYKIFRENQENYFLNVISDKVIPNKIHQFGDLLKVPLTVTDKYHTSLIKATVKLLSVLNQTKNITVYVEDINILQEFYRYTKEELMCIKTVVILEKKCIAKFIKHENGAVVFFGGQGNIRNVLRNFTLDTVTEDLQMIFVPMDGSETNDYPEGSYIIQPTYSEEKFVPINYSKPITSPLFFDIAGPIISSILNISTFIEENCNDLIIKLNCLRFKYIHKYVRNKKQLTPYEILKILNIDSFSEHFTYKIYRVENVTLQRQESNATDNENIKIDIFQSFVNVFTYNIFNESLNNYEVAKEDFNATEKKYSCADCTSQCVNFKIDTPQKSILISYAYKKIDLKNEAWVFGFLAISLLGVMFCLAILIFLAVRFCKKDILEGNPILTLLLLFSVILMYCSVIPFTLESDKDTQTYICIAQALSSTLSFAFAFSLLLARSILLATISKETGFLSHIPGPVQAFLTLFIFGIQGALSLQFLSHCEDIFRGSSFIYLMSYNIILLILLLFICPLNTKVQRNYKEGKHFTVAVVLLTITWSCWLPCYAVLEDYWKDPMLCVGLVSTASILLGSIFIPRTYVMTIAAAKDRLTSTFPSLNNTSSIMDVYRASTQPVYDCINIAAINARGIPPPPPPDQDIYSSLPVPFDDDFDFERCITPNQDKVTRF